MLRSKQRKPNNVRHNKQHLQLSKELNNNHQGKRNKRTKEAQTKEEKHKKTTKEEATTEETRTKEQATQESNSNNSSDNNSSESNTDKSNSNQTSNQTRTQQSPQTTTIRQLSRLRSNQPQDKLHNEVLRLVKVSQAKNHQIVMNNIVSSYQSEILKQSCFSLTFTKHPLVKGKNN